MSVLRRGVVGRCGQVSGLCIIINITHALGLEPDLLLFSIRRRTSCFSPPSHLSCSALRSITCPGSEPPCVLVLSASHHVLLLFNVTGPLLRSTLRFVSWTVPSSPFHRSVTSASLLPPSASSPGPFHRSVTPLRSSLHPLRLSVRSAVLSRLLRSSFPHFVSWSVLPFYHVRFVSWSIPPSLVPCLVPTSHMLRFFIIRLICML